MKTKGFVVYDGPSGIDGQPIVGILTVSSGNVKTGDMAQLWILRKDASPMAAAKTGADASVCGDCRHRGTIVDGKLTGRTCYVTLFQGPRAVHDAWKRGRYADATRMTDGTSGLAACLQAIHGKPVRLGAYGDPAALPASLLTVLVSGSRKHTGYTHQWRTCGEQYRTLCMASVDSVEEYHEATAAGWRTFRVSANTETQAGEIVCPASDAAGKVTTCERCGLCAGLRVKARNVAILAHGAGASRIIRLAKADA